MAKIFLVTDGDYSDFYIRGAFSTMELAVEAQRIWGANSQIDEFEIDQVPKRSRMVPAGMYVFSIGMANDGAVKYHSFQDATESFEPDTNPSVWCGTLQMRVMARDLEHAVKIVNEKRTQMIAENRWIDPTQEGLYGVMNAMRGTTVNITKEDLLRDVDISLNKIIQPPTDEGSRGG